MRTTDEPPRRGLLVLLVGASGVGKDSLLREIRRIHEPPGPFTIIPRFITRAPESSEDHIALSRDEFDAMEANGRLMLSWRANGFAYGIGSEVERHLAEGRCCICSVSRTVIKLVRQRYAPTFTIELVAPDDVRERRLLARGRESAHDVRQRLERTNDLTTSGVADLLIDNGGPLPEAVAAFVRALQTELAQHCRTP